MNTVLTVLKSGGEFTPDHVQKIKEMVFKHNNIKLYCLTDYEYWQLPSNVNHIPLRYNWQGWWSKIEMFNIDSNKLILYMDLDTVITGNIEHFFNKDIDFSPLHDAFQRLKGNIRMGSGLMLFRPSSMQFLFDNFKQNPEKFTSRNHGDQNYIESQIDINNYKFIQNLFPEQIFSFKGDLCEPPKSRDPKNFTGIPDDARIIFFHGEPRPEKVNYLNQTNK